MSIILHTVQRFLLKLNRVNKSQILFYASARLAEIGKFEEPRTDYNYDTGQLFLHKIFGYRGVVLFSCQAKFYDRDASRSVVAKLDSSYNHQKDEFEENNSELNDERRFSQTSTFNCNNDDVDVKARPYTYYQVLIDERDWPFLKSNFMLHSVSVISPTSHLLTAFPGIDFVGHSDILPYATVDDIVPIKHQFYHTFVPVRMDKESISVVQGNMKMWIEKYWSNLICAVNRQTTENVRITVMSFYMGYREHVDPVSHMWRYSIRVENLGEETVILRERSWQMYSLSTSVLEELRGKGVLGVQPVLSKRNPVFQYSSHITLKSSSGYMWGTFKMERENGDFFDCTIPCFKLESEIDGSQAPTIN